MLKRTVGASVLCIFVIALCINVVFAEDKTEKKAEPTKAVPEITTEQKVVTPTPGQKLQPTGKMTDEKYVEYMANMQILGMKYAEDMKKDPKETATKMTKEIESIIKKMDINTADLEEYNKKIAKDPKAYMELFKKVSEKVGQIQKENKK